MNAHLCVWFLWTVWLICFLQIVCTDFDELIVPRLHGSYQEMIDAIDKVQPRLHPHRSYMFRNVYFFLDFPEVSAQRVLIPDFCHGTPTPTWPKDVCSRGNECLLSKGLGNARIQLCPLVSHLPVFSDGHTFPFWLSPRRTLKLLMSVFLMSSLLSGHAERSLLPPNKADISLFEDGRRPVVPDDHPLQKTSASQSIRLLCQKHHRPAGLYWSPESPVLGSQRERKHGRWENRTSLYISPFCMDGNWPPRCSVCLLQTSTVIVSYTNVWRKCSVFKDGWLMWTHNTRWTTITNSATLISSWRSLASTLRCCFLPCYSNVSWFLCLAWQAFLAKIFSKQKKTKLCALWGTWRPCLEKWYNKDDPATDFKTLCHGSFMWETKCVRYIHGIASLGRKPGCRFGTHCFPNAVSRILSSSFCSSQSGHEYFS